MNSPNSIPSLPTELLTRICNYLPPKDKKSLTRVGSATRNVARDCLWFRPKFQNGLAPTALNEPIKVLNICDFHFITISDWAQAHLLGKMPGTCQVIIAESSSNHFVMHNRYTMKHLWLVSKLITRISTSVFSYTFLNQHAAEFGALPFPKLTSLIIDRLEQLSWVFSKQYATFR